MLTLYLRVRELEGSRTACKHWDTYVKVQDRDWALLVLQLKP